MKIGIQAARGIESSLIHQLRIERNVSRVELARRMELAPSTIGLYVDRLIGDGFVQEGAKAVQAAGRPPIVLRLNPNAGQFVGLDFEGRQVLATSVDFAQQPLAEHKISFRPADGVEQVLEKLVQAVNAAVVPKRRLLGIGIGVPGAVDPERGIGLHYEFIRGWQNVPVRDLLAQAIGVPVHIENNIRAMALAEQLIGAGRGVGNFICIGIRSGIGAGLVVNEELFRGPENLAGEIGGWPIEEGKTLEQLASCRALVRELEAALQAGKPTSLKMSRNRLSLELILQAARRRDPLVLSVLQRSAVLMGKVIAQLNLVINPSKVIIAGPLADSEESFVRPVREIVQQLARPPHATPPVVVASKLGEYAGALGGASLAVQSWQPVRATG